ncbi:MAG: Rrf2 family transcriptional regulator [Nitrospirae bacterium]|nr:Rrf2 family transcriptional regulator [Nitrospirota bacterium]MCL5421387.1 Rrf2 family transcriptional regulator [Nitrospirota bacterium]
MQITRQTDYAIRCILHLSESPGEIIMTDEIAKTRGIPKSFLSKILQRLVRARIVRSFRGAKGGFRLAKQPEKISLLEVIEAMEGSLVMNRCAFNKGKVRCGDQCDLHPAWAALRRELEYLLRGYSVAHLGAARGHSPFLGIKRTD